MAFRKLELKEESSGFRRLDAPKPVAPPKKKKGGLLSRFAKKASDFTESAGLFLPKLATGALAVGQNFGKRRAEKLGLNVPKKGESLLGDLAIHSGELGLEAIEKQQSKSKPGEFVGDVAGAIAVAGVGKTDLAAKATSRLATIVPNFVSQFPKVARYFGYAVEGATLGGGSAGSKSLLEGEEGKEVVRDTAWGMFTGAITEMAVPAVLESGAFAYRKAYEVLSGVPKEAVDVLVDNPGHVLNKIKEVANDPAAAQLTISESFDGAVDIAKKARGDAYKASLDEIAGRTVISQVSPDTVGATDVIEQGKEGFLWWKNDAGAWEKLNLSTKSIKETFLKKMKNFGFKIGDNGWELGTASMSSSNLNKLNELAGRIANWEDYTPEGFISLDKVIRSYDTGGLDKSFDNIVGGLAGETKSHINKNLPKIVQEMNKNFSSASDMLEDLRKNIGSAKTPIQTKVNRILGLFKEGSVYRKALIEELGEKSATDLINQVLIYTMSNLGPRGGLSRIVKDLVFAGSAVAVGAASPVAGAATLTAAPLVSPRIGAKVIGGLTKPAQAAGAVADIVKKWLGVELSK